MPRKIVIGDIHGCNLSFKSLLHEHLLIQKEDDIYILGDYVDRGPDSKGVLDTIMSLLEKGFQLHTLRGNHEQMMMDSANELPAFFQWILNGVEETQESFKVRRYQDLPERYRNFFAHTKLYLETDGHILVHAGLNFKEDDLFADQDYMLWGRGFRSTQKKLGDRILIHGHTPKPLEYILTQKGNCYNLDGGCVFGNKRKGMGYLVALILDEMKFVYTKCIDKTQ